MHVSPLAWVATLAVIVGLLVADELILGRRRGEVGFGLAVRWSAFYIAVAIAFGAALGLLSDWTLATEYFAGYVVEKSLSIDNLFVFVIIMSAFAVPAEAQPKALTIGIGAALGLRAVFIAIGAALLETFSFMFGVFGVALVVTAVQLYRHRDEDPGVDNNPLVSLARRRLPIARAYDGRRVMTEVDGRRGFTPLLLVLVAIGSSDLMFAFDSIPAVFGVTDHPFIVFAANAFALLGLRALFFLVSGLLTRLVYLTIGLAAILAFIGAKLMLEFVHHLAHGVPTISTWLSLAVIAVVLAATTIASLIRTRREPGRAHAGSVRRVRRPPGEVTAATSAPEPAPEPAGPG